MELYLGHCTLNYVSFAMPGHYGCPSVLLPKSSSDKSIEKLEFLKHFLLIKDMSKACGLDLNVALTKFPPHP